MAKHNTVWGVSFTPAQVKFLCAMATYTNTGPTANNAATLGYYTPGFLYSVLYGILYQGEIPTLNPGHRALARRCLPKLDIGILRGF